MFAEIVLSISILELTLKNIHRDCIAVDVYVSTKSLFTAFMLLNLKAQRIGTEIFNLSQFSSVSETSFKSHYDRIVNLIRYVLLYLFIYCEYHPCQSYK